ncbi:hypothetical protein VTO73DRAFT_9985 [Trametes versicolor]
MSPTPGLKPEVARRAQVPQDRRPAGFTATPLPAPSPYSYEDTTRDSAGLFVAPGTSTRCLTAAGKPTALVSADVDILQVPPASALAALSIAVSWANVPRRRSDDTARRPDTALLASATAYDRARRAGGSLRDEAAHRGIRPSDFAPPVYIAPPHCSGVSICVLQDNQQPLCASRFSGYGSGARDAEELGLARAPGPGAGLFVAPEISTRRGVQCLRGNQRAPK